MGSTLLARYGSLTACLEVTARHHMARGLVGSDAPDESILQLMKDSVCSEQSREVEIDADAHGLNRSGQDQWVPAALILLMHVADTMMSPAPGPAMFILKPGSAEEACVEPPEEPVKRCADTSGCEEAPDGAEPPTAGGVDLPPVPGVELPGGDSL